MLETRNSSIEQHPIGPINQALKEDLDSSPSNNTGSDDSPEKKANVTRSRRALLLVFACFTAPVAFAYFALYSGWYQSLGMKNSGLLIQPPVSIEELGISAPQSPLYSANSLDVNDAQPMALDGQFWRLVYALPKQCDTICENRLIQIRQSLIASGPHKKRVKALLIQPYPMTQRVQQWVNENQNVDIIRTTELELLKGLSLISQSLPPRPAPSNDDSASDDTQSTTPALEYSDHLFLLDPQNKIILAYPPASNRADWLSSGKAILKDLKHLLKVSRIG